MSERHGTVNSYATDKCRCTECRSAWADYNRLLRQRRAAIHPIASPDNTLLLREELNSAKEAAEGELAALIAEQDKDDRCGDRVYSFSLDAALTSDANAGSWYEITGEDDQRLAAAAGIESETAIRRIPRPQKWTRQQILTHIRRWAKEHGEPPSHADWNPVNGRGVPSAASVKRHFGTWGAAIREAGLEPHPIGGRRQAVSRRLRRRIERQHSIAYMTQAQIASAYVLYEREGLGVPELAKLLWRSYGYCSPRSCSASLHRAFHQEGFPLRSRSEARLKRFSAEERQAISRKGGRKSAIRRRLAWADEQASAGRSSREAVSPNRERER